MTLQQLNYIITIADTGSLSKAAGRLFISPPSLTAAVRDLEAELNVRLFNRTSHGTTLTVDGQAFLPYARNVITEYRSLLDAYGHPEKQRQRFAVSTQHYSFAVKAFVEAVSKVDVAEYELALRETRTLQVITDVATSRSEIGILFLSEANGKVVRKLLSQNALRFIPLITCNAYVYLWRGHPLAGHAFITYHDLAPYPCLAFEQGEESNFFLSEEILSTNEYPRLIRCCDRATMLNLMRGLHGYTLCSGIICEELNGNDYIAVPYQDDADNPNSTMTIGYITRKDTEPSSLGLRYVEELRRYLAADGADDSE